MAWDLFTPSRYKDEPQSMKRDCFNLWATVSCIGYIYSIASFSPPMAFGATEIRYISDPSSNCIRFRWEREVLFQTQLLALIQLPFKKSCWANSNCSQVISRAELYSSKRGLKGKEAVAFQCCFQLCDIWTPSLVCRSGPLLTLLTIERLSLFKWTCLSKL